MANFNHTEVTSSGIGGSPDTILILFPNQNENENSPKALSKKPTGSPQNQKSLNKILPSQELIKMGKFGGRGKIPETFSPGDEIDLSWQKNKFAKQCRLWILARYKDKSPLDNGPHIQSFAAVRSLLDSFTHFITKCAFTPILPYPATEYDAIITTMINFQDVLKQKKRENGPLWSDEGVYHIAKEIQLLYPQKFSNIFLGIGGFHLEKVVIGCLGTYLESSGIKNLLVEEKVYGPAVVNSVMSDGNYIRGKKRMSLIAEAMEQLQVYSFLHSSDGEVFSDLFDRINKLVIMMRDPSKNQVNITSQWSKCMKILDKFEEAFNAFKTSGSAESNLFAYWNNFLSRMAPVLRDLTRSFRDADWYLHLSSVSRAIDLCFSFDRINYECWLPIYYEDCLALPKHFPEMYQSFLNGDFVVRHSSRKGSAVPMDQALEKAHNKPAKSSTGNIGFTRRKEAVCKWKNMRKQSIETL